MAKSTKVSSSEVKMDRRRKDRRSDRSESTNSTSAAAEGSVQEVASGSATSGSATSVSSAGGEKGRSAAGPAGGERRKVQRRRQIDPTTCERDYTSEEIEFMQALDAYKRANGRMFPTCSEILEVVRGMGFERVRDAEGNPLPWQTEQLIEGEGEAEEDAEADFEPDEAFA